MFSLLEWSLPLLVFEESVLFFCWDRGGRLLQAPASRQPAGSRPLVHNILSGGGRGGTGWKYNREEHVLAAAE